MKSKLYLSTISLIIITAFTACEKEVDTNSTTIHIKDDSYSSLANVRMSRNYVDSTTDYLTINPDYEEYINLSTSYEYLGNSQGTDNYLRQVVLAGKSINSSIFFLKGQTIKDIYLSGYTYEQAVLNNNMPISEQTGSWSSSINLAELIQNTIFNSPSTVTLNLPLTGGYVGLKIIRNGTTYYGWIELTILTSSSSYGDFEYDFTEGFGYAIDRIAIQTDPSKTILPGQEK